MKTCPMCAKTLDNACFAKDKNKVSGLQSRCRQCHKIVRILRQDKDRKSAIAWQAAHREERNAACRAHYHKNKEKRLKQMKAWRDGGNGYRSVKRWRDSNPEAARTFNENRRARKKSAAGSYSTAQWLTKCEEYGNVCAYCRKKRKLTVHHVKALSCGGSNFIKNIVPACQSCNSRIGTKEIWPEVCHH